MGFSLPQWACHIPFVQVQFLINITCICIFSELLYVKYMLQNPTDTDLKFYIYTVHINFRDSLSNNFEDLKFIHIMQNVF